MMYNQLDKQRRIIEVAAMKRIIAYNLVLMSIFFSGRGIRSEKVGKLSDTLYDNNIDVRKREDSHYLRRCFELA